MPCVPPQRERTARGTHDARAGCIPCPASFPAAHGEHEEYARTASPGRPPVRLPATSAPPAPDTKGRHEGVFSPAPFMTKKSRRSPGQGGAEKTYFPGSAGRLLPDTGMTLCIRTVRGTLDALAGCIPCPASFPRRARGT